MRKRKHNAKADSSAQLSEAVRPAEPRRFHNPSHQDGTPRRSDAFQSELTVQQEADRIITQFVPPSVLIDSHFQILQLRGPTNAYLEPPKGTATFHLLKMAHEGLLVPLRSVINQAKKGHTIARRNHVCVEQNGRMRTVNLKVVPLRQVREPCFLVVFEDAAKMPKPSPGRRPAAQELRRLADLKRELADTREYLHSIQEQSEASNQELQASNEEVRSANEELQSLNEELETSKEELESSNEELTTVNEEMANRNAELIRLNADWLNLQHSINLPVLVLGHDLTIRQFTKQAERLFRLRGTNVGRPISSIRHNLRWVGRGSVRAEHREPEVRAGSERPVPEYGVVPLDMESVVAEVIATVHAREFEVVGPGDVWHLMRVRPYLTLENKVDGAVLVLAEITDLKRSQRELVRASEEAEAVIQTVRQPLLVLDGALRVERANRSFYQMFEVSPDETIGHLLYELGNHQWDSPDLRSLLTDIVSRRSQIEDFQIMHDFERLGVRTMLLSGRRLEVDVPGSSSRILFAIEDITMRLRSENQLRLLTNELTLAEQRERRRVASELHDYLAQLLALSNINLDQIKTRAQGQPFLPEIEEVGGLLEQALTYTRSLVAQLSPPVLHMFGLGASLKWLAEQMQSRGLFLTVELEEVSLSLSDDDALLLFYSVRELVLNVVKHGGTNQAKLAVTTAEGILRITVSDEGVGFDVAAAMAPAATDEQASRAPGFGLFSIRERMFAMGGRFELVSRPGGGTQATLIVSLADSEQRPVSSKPAEYSFSTAHSSFTVDRSNTKVRVLLVDDHAMLRQGLRSILESYSDIEVVGEAADGEAAVAAADHLRPSVVVMDINMPRMNGIEATAQIKARHPAVVVIGLSVQADAHSRSALLGAGAAALVTKEAAAEELYRTIRQVLESHLS